MLLNMNIDKPMPTASISTETNVKTGERSKARRAKRKSASMALSLFECRW